MTSLCGICTSGAVDYQFTLLGTRLMQCESCGFVFREALPASASAATQPSRVSVSLWPSEQEVAEQTGAVKRRTAGRYLDAIEATLGGQGKGPLRLLVVAGSDDWIGEEALLRGHEVVSLPLEQGGGPGAGIAAAGIAAAGLAEPPNLGGAATGQARPVDACLLIDSLSVSRAPVALLERVCALLPAGALLFATVPSLNSATARLMGANWIGFRHNRWSYFTDATLESLLVRCGFSSVRVQPDRKVLSFDYVLRHFTYYPVPWVTPLLRLIYALTPGPLRRLMIPSYAGGIAATARRDPRPPASLRRQSLSVIMPVYNERATFAQVMEPLLAKEIAGLDIEIVLVESNSTDGTRSEVLRFKDHPRVTTILEERPRGKGHAVRAGLAKATGDFILIQDADLEYDLDDYETLLEPLRTYRRALVVGSRHSGSAWKMRRFGDALLTSTSMNLGHIFFTGLFNLLYRQRLKDPFTMYKVFRRDCIAGMRLECNRFDFDCELIAKLVRRGYKPLEIPVNYQSRSYAQGKKISFFFDPWTYIYAFLKYRFAPLFDSDLKHTA